MPAPSRLHFSVFTVTSALALLITVGLRAQAPSAPDTARMDPAMAANARAAADLDWHDVTGWGAEGRAWPEQARLRWFDRLPAAAEKTVTSNVWNLSRDSAGMMVRFKTDATALHVHYKLTKSRLAMPHMPATGVSGIDFYARAEDGRWRWVQVAKPDQQEVRVEVVKDLASGWREYAAYLPLYNGVESLEIGVPKGAKFEGLAPRAEKPIVFYGTSITHGACASRPGMVHTAILGRRLDRPVVNLGFSGNGRMDAAVGEFLGQMEAAVYVIDCLPNMSPALVRERCGPLVRQLRAARPDRRQPQARRAFLRDASARHQDGLYECDRRRRRQAGPDRTGRPAAYRLFGRTRLSA